jgi:hypothetical protein
MTTSEMNDLNPLDSLKMIQPLNPRYGGDIARNVESDHEIQAIHDYAHVAEDWPKSIDDKMIPHTITAARKRPTLLSRYHTAHVLITRMALNVIKVQKKLCE